MLVREKSILIFVVLADALSFTLAAKKKKGKTLSCGPFPYSHLDHGKITASLGAQKLFFHCNDGYYLASDEQVRCYKGNWTSIRQPMCLRNGGLCEEPEPIDNADVQGKDRATNSQVQYFCKPGYVLVGQAFRTCLPNGYWSGIKPTCMEINEPVGKIAQRLKSQFVTNMSSYLSDSVGSHGRQLDTDSLKHGLDLIILIDRSSSIDPIDFSVGIEFVKFLLDEFNVNNSRNNSGGTRAAVITFGTEVDILFNLDNETITNPWRAEQALNTVKANGGGTAMESALMTVFTNIIREENESLLRENAKKAIFLLTDGEPNEGTEENTLGFAKLLQESGFEIFVVGVGRGINRQILSQLASKPPYSHVFILEKYIDLHEIMKTIKEKPLENEPISQAKCGYIENEAEYLKKWPWLAAVYVGMKDSTNTSHLNFCAGTLICSEWVITAASCFYTVDNGTEKKAKIKDIFVSLGERNLLDDEPNQRNYYATNFATHPDFLPSNNLQHNLGLIKLNIPAEMGRFRPACLAPTDEPVLLHKNLDSNVSIAGWGLATSSDSNLGRINGGSMNFHSSNFSVNVEEENICDEYRGKEAKDTIFCAGFGLKTCAGTIGSPIIAVDPYDELHHVIGVLSSRSFCDKGINQYTELTKYIEWIDDVTKHCRLRHQSA